MTTAAIRRGRGIHLAAALALLVAAGCSGDDTSAAEPSERAEVEIELVAFQPERIVVAAGSTVVWHQRDSGDHTVTSGTVRDGAAGVTQEPDGRFDSGRIPTGGRFEQTFDEPGTYPYFCALHPATMRGEIRAT
ncbi:MAG: cupredoxin domain-containing protein [Acidimicrobiales bacterium]